MHFFAIVKIVRRRGNIVGFGYNTDELTALEAITEAQKISFAPVLFQVALSLRDFGILSFLDLRGKLGGLAEEITENCNLNQYATDVLLDAGLSARIVYQREDKFYLSKVGYYLLHDEMTQKNLDFIQDVCYQGLFYLKESLLQQKPIGLKVFGDWPTIYPALSLLPEKAKKSWFGFDHFYSDGAFYSALKEVFSLVNPSHLYDVGGNTGKCAIECCKYNKDVEVTILDLAPQLTLAQENIIAHGFQDRIHTFSVDMLDIIELPNDADAWWMSQFLDCFSEAQIIKMLQEIRKAMKTSAKLCILEVFWDCQQFEAGAFSVNMSSLYFTCMANGNSRFYRSDVFITYLEKAGFKLDTRVDNLGVGHTLLIASPN